MTTMKDDDGPAMTTEQEAALREALEKATPGPWHDSDDGEGYRQVGNRSDPSIASLLNPEDAALIVLSVNSIPDLLSSLAAERAAREKAEAERDEAQLAAECANEAVADLAKRVEALAEETTDYDAGLLSDFGGGNVEWWQDYLRAELERANSHWRECARSLLNQEPKT